MLPFRPYCYPTLNFKKLRDNAVLPSYAKPGDAGLDLTASHIERDAEQQLLKVYTGLAVEIPVGHVGLLFPRSSVCKTGLILANSVGVIDSGYRGEIIGVFRILNPQAKLYQVGERALQLIVLPIPSWEPALVEQLSDTERGSQGFGSSGG